MEQAPSVTRPVAEDIPGQVFDVGADERGLFGPDLPLHQDEMLAVVDVARVHDGPELASEAARDAGLGPPVDERVVLAAIVDQVGDRRDLERMAGSERLEVRKSRHRPIVAENLANDAGRHEPGEPGEVDRTLGLPRAHEDAAAAGAQREDVTRRHDVGRAGIGPDGGADRRRAIDRGDAARDTVACIDRDGEGRAERRPVLAHHHGEAQLLAVLLGERETDEPTAMRRHEVDVLGGQAFRGDAEVPLVLAILVVHEDDRAARAELCERLVDPDHVGAVAPGRHARR